LRRPSQASKECVDETSVPRRGLLVEKIMEFHEGAGPRTDPVGRCGVALTLQRSLNGYLRSDPFVVLDRLRFTGEQENVKATRSHADDIPRCASGVSASASHLAERGQTQSI
jgi:hypothetical protein